MSQRAGDSGEVAGSPRVRLRIRLGAHRMRMWLATVLMLAVSGGCAADRPVNPSFNLTVREAREALERMAAHPVELERPVVVLDGWMDPGLASLHLGPAVVRHTGDRRVVTVSFFGASSFEQCMARVVEKVESVFPQDDPDAEMTRPVDVVAFSMGGLVARYAHLPARERARLASREAADPVDASRRRLNIVRLFTISSPHRGANWAEAAPSGGLVGQMRPDSALIARLDATLPEAGYTIYPYVRLGDRKVGEASAAPEGEVAWWVPTSWISLHHAGAYKDPRIMADIFARLRGEEPFAREPAIPLPAGGR